MRRIKRDRNTRAFQRGYQAGLTGKHTEDCPHQALNYRGEWLAGWRQGREEIAHTKH